MEGASRKFWYYFPDFLVPYKTTFLNLFYPLYHVCVRALLFQMWPGHRMMLHPNNFFPLPTLETLFLHQLSDFKCQFCVNSFWINLTTPLTVK